MSQMPSGGDGPRMESLFDLVEPTADWSEADLTAMLRHQLAQPLEPGGPTIRALLDSPGASMESLQSLKRLAKVRRAQAHSPVPPDLWRVIYFASIAAAVRAGYSISELSTSDMLQGFQWTLGRPWVDEVTRRIVSEAMARTGY